MSIAEPGIAIVYFAAPAGFGNVVVEVDVDILSFALFRDGVEDLHFGISARTSTFGGE